MYRSRCLEHDVVVFISLPLQEALNHWFNEQDPQVQVLHFRWRRRKRGREWSEESGRRDECVEYRRGEAAGIIITLVEAVGKQHGNQLVVIFLFLLLLWASPFIFSPPSDPAGPLAKVTREASPDRPPNMCVPAPSWPTPLISASIESEQMALWPGSPSPYTVIIGHERMIRLAQTPEGMMTWVDIENRSTLFALAWGSGWHMLFVSRFKHSLLYIDLEKWWAQHKACHQKAAEVDLLLFCVSYRSSFLVFMFYKTKENSLEMQETTPLMLFQHWSFLYPNYPLTTIFTVLFQQLLWWQAYRKC